MQSKLAFTSSLGKAINAERSAAALTLQDVRAATGLSSPYLSQIENGQRTLPSDKLVRIAELFGLNPNELLAIAESDDYRLDERLLTSNEMAKIRGAALHATCSYNPVPSLIERFNRTASSIDPPFPEKTDRSPLKIQYVSDEGLDYLVKLGPQSRQSRHGREMFVQPDSQNYEVNLALALGKIRARRISTATQIHAVAGFGKTPLEDMEDRFTLAQSYLREQSEVAQALMAIQTSIVAGHFSWDELVQCCELYRLPAHFLLFMMVIQAKQKSEDLHASYTYHYAYADMPRQVMTIPILTDVPLRNRASSQEKYSFRGEMDDSVCSINPGVSVLSHLSNWIYVPNAVISQGVGVAKTREHRALLSLKISKFTGKDSLDGVLLRSVTVGFNALYGQSVLNTGVNCYNCEHSQLCPSVKITAKRLHGLS